MKNEFMKKILLTLIVVIAGGIFNSLCAQSFTVTGTVVDMNDETMPGVNIVEQGVPTNGAISDVMVILKLLLQVLKVFWYFLSLAMRIRN